MSVVNYSKKQIKGRAYLEGPIRDTLTELFFYGRTLFGKQSLQRGQYL